MPVPNDERGWALACASGLACMIGACIICVDLLAHQVPRWRDFNIRESSTFLAASLALSFGVMFYSSLHTMLPEARAYFDAASWGPSLSAAATMSLFLVGVAGLQIVTELLHHCLPSSIVSCEDHGAVRSRPVTSENGHAAHPPDLSDVREVREERDDELTPLLERRPSLRPKLSIKNLKLRCDTEGKCYGYADHDCDQACRPKPLKRVSSAPLPDPKHHFHHRDHRHDDEESHTPSPVDGAGEHEHGHHHVATNQFLSIGVQTSIAIALHKFPEGFITYATNHVNPDLGFTVFLALFIHNIAEGFAISLPLFLAVQSRFKAILWASLLGGLSQPLGAFIAWLSLHVSGRDRGGGGSDGDGAKRGDIAYGFLFAITAGIMCSVGLQLFAQAVTLRHGGKLVFVCGFVGMAIMGYAGALTAEH